MSESFAEAMRKLQTDPGVGRDELPALATGILALVAPPTEIIIVRAVQNFTAYRSQWEAWDADGRQWYLRYHSGVGIMYRDYDFGARLSFDTRIEDGDVISLEDFCRAIGVNLALSA